MPLPLLLAVSPLPSDAFQPYVSPAAAESADVLSGSGPVETFDPIGRAELIAREMPRYWGGFYRPYQGGEALPVELRIASATPMGQMVDIRGILSVGGIESPVQGNLNAKSDQLDLLVLTNNKVAGLEAGGEFQGLESMALNGWIAPRLTNSGGQLVLNPVQLVGTTPRGVTKPQPVQGLW
jgi:hypothetical protein